MDSPTRPNQPASPGPRRPWRIVHSEVSLGWGGQEHRVLAELAGFARRGHEVWLLAPRESQLFSRASNQSLRVVDLRPGKPGFLPEIFRVARWLTKNRIDVANTHSSRDGWLVGLAARLARVPLLIRSRHIDVDYPNPSISRFAYRALSDHLITTSDRITTHFQEVFHLPGDRISTVPTGVDLGRFSPATEPARDLIHAGGTPLVGMISVLRSWKGHETFLQAARLLIDEGFKARFIIVGDGPIAYRVKEWIAELKLENDVVLAGHREDVPALLRALQLLVIASTRHEGVPQIGLQALASGTPVVGSDVGGIPEIIRPGVTGRIFPAGDVVRLATAIRETLEQPTETRRLAENGLAWVRAEQGTDAMLDRVEAIYRRYLP